MARRLLVAAVVACIMLCVAAGCNDCPICESGKGSYWTCWLNGAPTKAEKPQMHSCLSNALAAAVIGHDGITSTILNHVTQKMAHPGRPMILHFAGDNGVGKTFTAKQISLATSLRRAKGCGSEACDYGENMIVISAAGYFGMDAADVRRSIVGKVTTHLKKHAQGIVLLDDAQLFAPDAFRSLAPLLGAASEFPEYPGVHLNEALVILTTDFGKEGRTRGLSSEEIRSVVQDEMRAVYEYANVKHISTFPFLPFNTISTTELLTRTVANTPCRDTRVRRAEASALAISSLQRSLNEEGQVRIGNGRSIVDALYQHIDMKVSTFALTSGSDVKVDVLLLQNDEGEIVLRVTPLDGVTQSEDL